MKHEITPEELKELPVGIVVEIGDMQVGVSLSAVTATFCVHEEDHNCMSKFVTEAGDDCNGKEDIALATQLLKSLDKAGYVVLKKGSIDSQCPQCNFQLETNRTHDSDVPTEKANDAVHGDRAAEVLAAVDQVWSEWTAHLDPEYAADMKRLLDKRVATRLHMLHATQDLEGVRNYVKGYVQGMLERPEYGNHAA